MKAHEKTVYICNQCQWQGSESELDFDQTETCFGEDRMEVCPTCGSLDVRMIVSRE